MPWTISTVIYNITYSLRFAWRIDSNFTACALAPRKHPSLGTQHKQNSTSSAYIREVIELYREQFARKRVERGILCDNILYIICMYNAQLHFGCNSSSHVCSLPKLQRTNNPAASSSSSSWFLFATHQSANVYPYMPSCQRVYVLQVDAISVT